MKTQTTIIPFFFAIAFFFSACGNSDEPITIDTEGQEETEALISVTKQQFSSQEMKFDSLTLHSFSGNIHCTGKIDVPPEYKADVSSYFGGYVKNIQLVSGTYVKKGQALFQIENPAFIDTQREFLEKKNELKLLESEFERQTDLAKSNATSQKVLLKTESDYQTALISYESLKKKLELMFINTDKLNAKNLQSSISVKSPISGYVTAIYISKGMFLDPQKIAISIEGTDHKHMELKLYEKDIQYVKIDQPIHIYIAGNTNKTYEGVVHLINKSIDLEDRTVTVHGHFLDDMSTLDNLYPGMYIEGDIETYSTQSVGLNQSTITNSDEKYYALQLVSEDDINYFFKKVEVILGESFDGFTQIVNSADLDANAKYLGDGAYQLVQ